MLDRRMRKRIEWAFYNYDKLKGQGAEYLVELAERGVTAQYGGVGVHSGGVGNPTESKGIKAVDGNTAAKWCKVVENTLVAFRWEIEYSVIQMYFLKRMSRARICDKLGIAERTFTYWTDRILSVAEQWARDSKLF